MLISLYQNTINTNDLLNKKLLSKKCLQNPIFGQNIPKKKKFCYKIHITTNSIFCYWMI